MNVAFDPWIPAVNMEGERVLISLNQVFTEGEKYADLAVRPHERVSLMRLFMCIAHAALDGPKDYAEWEEVPKQLLDAASEYLQKWKDSFELFHPEKPWLQVIKLKPAKENDEKSFTPLAKLDFAMASGATATIFDHGGGAKRSLDYSQLILGLIGIQNFSTCGLLSRPLWNGSACPNSAKDAPCITSSMFHVFLQGTHIQETICLNLCDYEELSLLFKSVAVGTDWVGKPVWEAMPNQVDDDGSTKTYLGRLVPISRAILFDQNKPYMLYGEGLRYPVFPDFPQEAHCSVTVKKIKDKEERVLVGAKQWMRPWRQLDAILQYNLPKKNSSSALSLSHLDNQAVDIWIGTLLRNPGKQDIIDSVESRFHIPSNLRTQNGYSSYSQEVEKAEQMANKLNRAAYVYRIEIDPSNESGLGSSATNNFWTSVEKKLPLLMSHIEAIGLEDAEPTRDIWRKMLFRAALDAYSTACGQETPRQMRAFAKGWQVLTNKKEKTESDMKKKEEVSV